MLVLALDTATLVSSVALVTGNTLLAELTLQTRKTHSERLMPHIARILDMAEINKNQLKAIAVSIGPGSFTGLRIGLTTAKTLAYALNIPIIGVPTLQALAYAYPLPGIIISPILDAQKNNVYQALFCYQDGELKEVMSPRVVNYAVALDELAQLDKPVVVLGEAAVMYCEEFKNRGGNIVVAPPHNIIPRAGSIALLGQILLRKGVTHDAATLEPLYIRRSEAEELWEKRHGVCT